MKCSIDIVKEMRKGKGRKFSFLVSYCKFYEAEVAIEQDNIA
jgi:hypothetical protein